MLDPSTGEVEWQTQVPLCPWDPVKLENGNVVVASGDQVFAFDPETGDTVWTLEPGPRTLDSWALQDGSVAVLSWQGEQLFVTTIEADGSEVVNHELPYPPTFWETILGVTRWDGETAVFMTDGEASRMFTLSGEAIGRPGMVQTTSWVGWWGASEVPGYNRYGGCSVQDQGLLCWGRAGVGSLLHVVPDRSSPQVRIQDTSTRSQAGQETISVTGSVQEDVRVAFGLIEARRGEERLQSPLNVTVQGTFQGSLSLPEEGAWNVTVEVHDTAGHVSSSSRSVQVGEG